MEQSAPQGPKQGDWTFFCSHAEISENEIHIPAPLSVGTFPEAQHATVDGLEVSINWFIVCDSCLGKPFAKLAPWVGETPSLDKAN